LYIIAYVDSKKGRIAKISWILQNLTVFERSTVLVSIWVWTIIM